MKIILSRKGVDSGNCKASNLVIFDCQGKSEMIMIPIPSSNDKIAYKDVTFSKDKEKDLYVKNYLKNFKIDLSSLCHIDPNLSNYLDEMNFLGSVGQIESSQSHLMKQEIQKDDLFIFFGKYEIQKFSQTKVEKIAKDKHIMFGYLQIGEIICPNSLKNEERASYEEKYPWIKNQPHWNFEKYKNKKSNRIYIAREKCSFDESIKGFGIFNFSEDLILTKNGRSIYKWELKKPLMNLKITYHNESNYKEDYFQSASRGQEFVIEKNEKAEKWAVELIKNHTN